MRSQYATASFMHNQPLLLQRWLLRCLPMVLAMAIPATTVHAQGYEPAHPGDQTLDKFNPFNTGQRSDLDIQFEHEFSTEPCPTASDGEIIKTCTIKVTLDWKPDPVYGWWQNEHDDNCVSADQFILYWEGFLHWSLESADRDGESIFGGSTPEGELFGNGTIDGLRMVIPENFENGNNGHQSITYTVVLRYIPDADCDTQPLIVAGHYIHTFYQSGDFWVAIRPSLSVRPGMVGGVPALIPAPSASLDWGFTSRAWQKQMFQPGGMFHKKTLTPPEGCLPHEGCCGENKTSDPPSPPDVTCTVSKDLWDQITVTTTVHPVDEPITSVSIMGWTEDGIEIAQLFHALAEPSWEPLVLEHTCQVPRNCITDNLHFVVTGRSQNGGTVDQGFFYDNSDSPLPRFVENDAIIDSRLVAPGILMAEIPHTDADPSSIAGLNHVYAVDQYEQVADEEPPFKIVNNGNGYTLYYHVEKSETRTPNNGVLEVLNHDFVQLFSQTAAEWDAIGIPVVSDSDPSAVNIYGAESVELDLLQILGTATGGTFKFDFGLSDQPVVFMTTPGAAPEETASQMVDAINASGLSTISAELHEPDKIRLFTSDCEFHVQMVDAGIDMRCIPDSEPDRPADFNNDGLVNAADLGLLLAAWEDSGFTDINNDGTTNAADLGMLLADWG